MSTRRTLLSATAAAVALGGTPKATVAKVSPDAELIAACQEMERLEHARSALSCDLAFGSPEAEAWEADDERLHDAQLALVPVICGTALTIEGLRAKARALVAIDEEAFDVAAKSDNDMIRTSILRDLMMVRDASVIAWSVVA